MSWLTFRLYLSFEDWISQASGLMIARNILYVGGVVMALISLVWIYFNDLPEGKILRKVLLILSLIGASSFFLLYTVNSIIEIFLTKIIVRYPMLLSSIKHVFTGFKIIINATLPYIYFIILYYTQFYVLKYSDSNIALYLRVGIVYAQTIFLIPVYFFAFSNQIEFIIRLLTFSLYYDEKMTFRNNISCAALEIDKVQHNNQMCGICKESIRAGKNQKFYIYGCLKTPPCYKGLPLSRTYSSFSVAHSPCLTSFLESNPDLRAILKTFQPKSHLSTSLSHYCITVTYKNIFTWQYTQIDNRAFWQGRCVLAVWKNVLFAVDLATNNILQNPSDRQLLFLLMKKPENSNLSLRNRFNELALPTEYQVVHITESGVLYILCLKSNAYLYKVDIPNKKFFFLGQFSSCGGKGKFKMNNSHVFSFGFGLQSYLPGYDNGTPSFGRRYYRTITLDLFEECAGFEWTPYISKRALWKPRKIKLPT